MSTKYTRHRQLCNGDCIYNPEVVCDASSWCFNCGWSTEVEEKRKERLREIYPKKTLEIPIVVKRCP